MFFSVRVLTMTAAPFWKETRIVGAAAQKVGALWKNKLFSVGGYICHIRSLSMETIERGCWCSEKKIFMDPQPYSLQLSVPASLLTTSRPVWLCTWACFRVSSESIQACSRLKKPERKQGVRSREWKKVEEVFYGGSGMLSWALRQR